MKKQVPINKVLVGIFSALFIGISFGVAMPLTSKYSNIFLFIGIGINSLHLLLPENHEGDKSK